MNWYKTAKDVKGHSYSWVYVDLPKEISSKIIELGKEIDSNDLFVKEADGGLETDPHVTVKYGLLTEDISDVRDCLEKAKGGKVYLGKSSVFECDEYDVVKVSVESEALDILHTKLNCLPHEDKHIEYKPHATIAYVKAGKGKKYDGKFVVGKEFKIVECYFGNNKKDYTVKLGNTFNLMRRS